MLTATVQFECEGGFPERFLNEASKRGVRLWGVTRYGTMLSCCCKAADYRHLRGAAKSASVRMRVRRRLGLPFLLRPFRLRWGLVLGAVLFVVILRLLSSRVWIVQIYGNERVTDVAIREVLATLGVYEGADPKTVDLPTIRLTALERLPDLTWLTVNFEGSTATVQVRERKPSPPLAENTPANVVAARDGVIVHIDALCGQTMVKAGDAVTEGTLLISGVMDSKVGPLVKRAEGSVTARTTRVLSVTVPFEERVVSSENHVVVRPRLVVFGWRIPLYANTRVEGMYTTQEHAYPLCINGKALPVGIFVTRLAFQTTTQKTRSDAEALAVAKAQLAVERERLCETFTIESETVSEQKTETGWTVTVTCIGIEEIGRVEPFDLQEKQKN